MIEHLLSDKTINAKEKVTKLSLGFLNQPSLIDDAIALVSTKKDVDKANVMEAIEHATKTNAEMANETVLHFALKGLASSSPRLQWESARVLGNIAKQFQEYLPQIIEALLELTKSQGTVVRWSAAFALGEIILLKSEENKSLLTTLEPIIEAEEKNSIKKIYLTAIKKVNKS